MASSERSARKGRRKASPACKAKKTRSTDRTTLEFQRSYSSERSRRVASRTEPTRVRGNVCDDTDGCRRKQDFWGSCLLPLFTERNLGAIEEVQKGYPQEIVLTRNVKVEENKATSIPLKSGGECRTEPSGGKCLVREANPGCRTASIS